MSTIYIVSPTFTATGGTELLHQLSEKLLNMGLDARMYYIGEYYGSSVEKRFSHYKTNICDKIIDDKDNLIIVPETRIGELFKYKHIQKAVWWLSVDFYPGSFKCKTDLIHKIVRIIRDSRVRLYDKKWIHFVQSEYARLYLRNKRNISENNIYPLSDYISNTFFEGIDVEQKRKNQVLYNPKKGIEFSKNIIKMCPEVEWIPLINMTPVQMKNTMLSSKVYIDFGNHPGKDRIPREAALCGCCIITGRRGSANNNVDVMIPNKYKFKDIDSSVNEIKKKILECIQNYENISKDFNTYRIKIQGEEQQFQNDVENYFLKVMNNGR